MACCAVADCGVPTCAVCRSVERFAVVECRRSLACRFVDGHPNACEPRRAGKVERADLKDSEPLEDLSAPRAAAAALSRMKRTRVGPHR